MEDKLKQRLASSPTKRDLFFQECGGEIIYMARPAPCETASATYFLARPTSRWPTSVGDGGNRLYPHGSEKEAAFLENNFVQRYQPSSPEAQGRQELSYLKLTVGKNIQTSP